MGMTHWRHYFWQMHVPKALGILFTFTPLCSTNCSFPMDMNYSRFTTSVSEARKAFAVRVQNIHLFFTGSGYNSVFWTLLR